MLSKDVGSALLGDPTCVLIPKWHSLIGVLPRSRLVGMITCMVSGSQARSSETLPWESCDGSDAKDESSRDFIPPYHIECYRHHHFFVGAKSGSFERPLNDRLL